MDFLEELKEQGLVVPDNDVKETVQREPQVQNNIVNFNNVTKLRLNQVVVGVRDDMYQQIYLDSAMSHLNMKRDSFKIYKDTDVKKIKHFTRMSIFNENSILMIDIHCKMNPVLLDVLSRLYTDNKIVIITVRNNGNVGFLVNHLGSKNKKMKLTTLKTAESYSDKSVFIDKTLNNMDLKYQSKEVRNVLVKVLVSKVESYNTIKTSLEVAELNETLITIDFIEDMVGSVDFYRLDDLFDFMIRGANTKKSFKYLNYFIKTKKYNSTWILNEFREYLLLISDFYMLKNNGYISHSIDSYTLENRISIIDFYSKNKVLKLSKFEQEKLLDFTEDIPYTYISHISKLVMNNKNLKVNEAEFKALIYEIMDVRSSYSEKEFVNQRKLQKMKQNAKYRKKKK